MKVNFVERKTGKRKMEEAFVWTIPHFSKIREQVVKSNVFRYHDFNW